MPELKELIRIFQIISLCKTSAFELYQHLVNSNWKTFRTWMQTIDRENTYIFHGEIRKHIFMIVEKLITTANCDVKKDSKVETSEQA